MADGYNEKSCSALEKPYYKPIEVALRWCNLIQHEEDILRATGNALFPDIGAFPQWPCLRANAEKIYDAIQNEGLPHGRDGSTVTPGDHVAKERLTIQHDRTLTHRVVYGNKKSSAGDFVLHEFFISIHDPSIAAVA